LLQSSVSKQSPTPDQPSNTTADIASAKKTFQEKPQQDWKFNVVIYGIDECPKGTPRHERSGLDLSNVAQIITKVAIDESINPLSIRDLHRLGKYQEKSRRPRPILTRFNRVIDVSLLLSKSSSFPIGIRIKPDMTPDEQQIESILLKERWTLIQKDTEHRAIKIRGNKIFLNNKLHGEVKDSKLFLQISQDQQMDQTNNN